MTKFAILAALLCSLLIPAFAADTTTTTPDNTGKRITNLEKTTQVIQEDVANTKLALEDTQDKTQTAIDTNAKAIQDLSARLDQLQKALNAEVVARGKSDKLIAELQTSLVNEQLKNSQLQEALNKEIADRQAADAALSKSIQANTSRDKKDRTITYGMGLLLGILAIAK